MRGLWSGVKDSGPQTVDLILKAAQYPCYNKGTLFGVKYNLSREARNKKEAKGYHSATKDPSLLDDWAALHVSGQVLAKGVVVQLEKPEGKPRIDVWPELGVLLVAADGHGVALRLQVDAEVVVSHVWQTAVHAGDGLGQDHGMLHGLQRYLHTCRGATGRQETAKLRRQLT